MFRIHRSFSSDQRKWAGVGLIALIVIFMLGALGATGTRVTHAQAARIALDSVVATTTGVNLRSQPDASGDVVVAMPVNARAIVIGGPFNDSWYWLDYNGTRGYASGKFLVLVDDKYTPMPLETATATSTPIGTVIAPPPVSTGGPQPTQVGGATPTITSTPDYTAPSTPGDYNGLWLGEMSQGGNVRNGPGLTSKVVKGWWAGRRVLLYQAVTDEQGGVWYRVSEPPEAPLYVHASLVRRIGPVIFETARYRGKWINVNLTQQIVTAYDGGTPVKVTLVSTGKAKTPTERGTWKIYWRLPKQTMEGGNLASGDYYRLENVPFPQYFHISGESFHGTYWHDNFVRPMSHGCVNMTTPMSGWLYGWAGIGTIVYVHN
jgi:lipoprotein-anchoring transpeptidase ErfK/SrfK